MAAAALLEKKVKRIVLARPAVEAGERLGFLPGDMVEKVNPYLRPLYDALYDILGYEKTAKLLERGIIEVAPIAFMRGRTLNDAFIILDEAQNTTSEQMRMFLTRIGFGSKAVVTGDITQVDLPQGKTSGLREAQQLLSRIEGIRFVLFDERDVVRHPLVQSIISAYEPLDRSARRPRREPLFRGPLGSRCRRKRPRGARRPLSGTARLRAERDGSPPIVGLRPFFWAAALRHGDDVRLLADAVLPQRSPSSRVPIATRDVVAPRDLIVPDAVATERRRSEAAAEVLAGVRLGHRRRLPREGSCGTLHGAREAGPSRAAVRTPRRRHRSVRDAFELPIGDEALSALARLSFSRAIEDRLVDGRRRALPGRSRGQPAT